jgi:hypothetical protein
MSMLERLNELFPQSSQNYEIKSPNEFEHSTKSRIRDLVYDYKFIPRDVHYKSDSDVEQYLIIKYNRNGKELYGIKYLDTEYLSMGMNFWEGSEILEWDFPSKIFRELCEKDYCPVVNYIYDGSSAHQSDLKIIFDKVKDRVSERNLEISAQEQFQSLLDEFRKKGSGIVKFPYNERIKTLFINRQDILLKHDDIYCVLHHNLDESY